MWVIQRSVNKKRKKIQDRKTLLKDIQQWEDYIEWKRGYKAYCPTSGEFHHEPQHEQEN